MLRRRKMRAGRTVVLQAVLSQVVVHLMIDVEMKIFDGLRHDFELPLGELAH